jgi:hypothetical protein
MSPNRHPRLPDRGDPTDLHPSSAICSSAQDDCELGRPGLLGALLLTNDDVAAASRHGSEAAPASTEAMSAGDDGDLP